MKTELTTKQSQHLIELGVPEEKASKEIIENICQQEYSEHRPKIFTLDDLLEILPKEINFSNFYMIGDKEKWNVGYGFYSSEELYSTGDFDFDTYVISKELIDALYELLCWVIENEHLKFD